MWRIFSNRSMNWILVFIKPEAGMNARHVWHYGKRVNDFNIEILNLVTFTYVFRTKRFFSVLHKSLISICTHQK